MREKYISLWMEVFVFEEKDEIVCSAGESNETQNPSEVEDFWEP